MSNQSNRFYDLLDEFEGMTHAELLEQQPVRQLFYWEAKEFPREDWDDLRQQAFLFFLEAAQIKPAAKYKFSRYLMVTVRHIMLKAYRFKYRKKRFLPTRNFGVNKETGRFIEPAGSSAVVLFDHDEVTQIRETIWGRVKDEERRDLLMQVLDGVLDGESTQGIAHAAGLETAHVYRAKKTLRTVLSQ